MNAAELNIKLDDLFDRRAKAQIAEHQALNETISSLVNDLSNAVALAALIVERKQWRHLRWVKDETFIGDIVTKHRDAVLDYFASRPENKSRLFKVLKQLASDDPRFIKAEAQGRSSRLNP